MKAAYCKIGIIGITKGSVTVWYWAKLEQFKQARDDYLLKGNLDGFKKFVDFPAAVAISFWMNQ